MKKIDRAVEIIRGWSDAADIGVMELTEIAGIM